MHYFIKRWILRLFNVKSGKPRHARPNSKRLHLECLEDRVTPSSYALTTLGAFYDANNYYFKEGQGNPCVDSNGNLFGTTPGGGAYGTGSVFEVAAGSGVVTTLASFNGASFWAPEAGVVEDSSGDLFGTTYQGGASGLGTVFEVVRGSGVITTLVNFNNTNGATPFGGLVEDSSGNIFGETSAGGPSGDGTVYEIVHGSSAVTTLVAFTNGVYPDGGLVADSGGDLFGIDRVPSASTGYSLGAVFEIAKGSHVATTLATFGQDGGGDGGPGNYGYYPVGNLIVDSSGNIFGETPYDTDIDLFGETIATLYGTVFEIAHGSGNVTTLANFNANNGSGPDGGLVEDSSGDLFGETYGTSEVFEVAHRSGVVTAYATFYSAAVDGATPTTLLEDGSGDLFGTTYAGGSFNLGTAFEIAQNSRLITPLASFSNDTGSFPEAGLVEDGDGNLFGTTDNGGSYGGAYDAGTVFEVANGSNFISTAASFNGTFAAPYTGLIEDSGGNLFGESGGLDGFGAVFEVAAGTGAITTLANFGANVDPIGGLVEDSSGDLFGATEYGGLFGDGTVFEIVHGTGAFVTIASFNGATGTNPNGGLVIDGSGDLFGTTASYSEGVDTGTVFEIVAGSGGVITTLASFSNGSVSGPPNGGLLIDGSGDLFGTTTNYQTENGTVFEVVHGSGSATTLATFNSVATGYYANGGLVEDSSGDLFGTTELGGASEDGTVFEIVHGSGVVTDIFSFDGANGASPNGGLIRDSNGNLFGATVGDHIDNEGTVFELSPLTPTTTTLTDNGPNSSTSAQSVSFTVGVSGGVPNGESVTLEDASNGDAVVPTTGNTLSNGSATLTVAAAALTPGTHNLFAVYAGDATFASSQSSNVTQTVQPTVAGTPTTTTLTDNGPNASTIYQSVNFTVTVSGGVPNGESVILEDASNGDAVVPTTGNTLSSGSATLTLAAGTLSSGTYSLFAVYGGDTTFAGSQSSDVTQTIYTSTTTTLTENGPNPSTTAQSVSFTVQVTGGVPNGESVILEDYSNNEAIVPTTGGTLSNGSATLTVPAGALTVGTHELFAKYSVDSSFLFSESNYIVQTVAPPLTFAAQQTFAVGNLPEGVAVADLSGNGKPDIVTANFGDGTISVLMNLTAPGATAPVFSAPQTFAVGSGPFSVAAADINDNGKMDLAVVNSISNTVSVLMNTTAPGSTVVSFAAQQTFSVGTTPKGVAFVDVNEDGRPDIVVSNFGANSVSVLLNTTTLGSSVASFAAQKTIAVGNEPYAVAAGDINGDGRPDLAVSNYGSNTVSVLLNTTPLKAVVPTFAAQQTFAVGASPTGIALANLNGDGRPDLAVANNGGGAGTTVSVLLNATSVGSTTAVFFPQQTFTVGAGPVGITVGDFNGDGKEDLAVGSQSGGSVSVLANITTPVGSETFSFATQTFATGTAGLFPAAADFNFDGRVDLVVANQGGRDVSVLLNTTAKVAVTGPVEVADFQGTGVWEFNRVSNAWVNLTPTDANVLAAGPDGTIVGNFPGYGVNLYTPGSGWQVITPSSASILAIDAQDDIVGNFTGYGVYMDKYASGWTLLTPTSATLLALDAYGDVVGQFSGIGVWMYRPITGFVQLTPTSATLLSMDAYGDVVGNFAGIGVWLYRPTTGWTQITTTNASALSINAAGEIAGVFSSYGTFIYSPITGWSQVTASSPSLLAIDSYGHLYGNFGAYGVNMYTPQVGWSATPPTTSASFLTVGDWPFGFESPYS